jgi:hypothetical protein
MKHVATDEHQLRRKLDHLVDRMGERLRDIGLTLIDPARSQPLILAEAKVEIGKVDEAQGYFSPGRLTDGAETA